MLKKKNSRRTKIICTIGPASDSVEIISEMLLAGMNVARLNFSHGTQAEHIRRIASIRKASKMTQIPVAIMLDTKGPEIRVGILEGGSVELSEGIELQLTVQDIQGTPRRIPVTYDLLPKEVFAGTRILLDDGLMELSVIRVEGTEIYCRVINGGVLTSRKKINIPGLNIKLPGLTEKDIDDIKLGIAQDVDIIAASFVRSAEDVLGIRSILEEAQSQIVIISKIENHQGVKNLDEIIRVSDGIMVARGDLGVEIPAEEVPIVQKILIGKCNSAGKPVITATQMLDSMIRNPRPTRAEASDIANAIYDGTDAIMLSGETANGKYPLLALQTMAKIALRIEETLDQSEFSRKRAEDNNTKTTEAISRATCEIARSLGADAIITSTQSGFTARQVAKHRPLIPVIAVTPCRKVCNQLLMVWGLQPLISEATDNTDSMIGNAVETALKKGCIAQGDLVVITAGIPAGIPGSTNLIKVHSVGVILAQGTGIGKRSVAGEAIVLKDSAGAAMRIRQGDILVAANLDRDYVPALEKAGALITEEGGITSPGAVMAMSMGLPVIVGVENATSILEDIGMITVDPARGLIYRGNTRVL